MQSIQGTNIQDGRKYSLTGRFYGGNYMIEKKPNNFDEITAKRLAFIKWLEAQDGRPDKHGVQTQLPEWTKKAPQEPTERRHNPFIPDGGGI